MAFDNVGIDSKKIALENLGVRGQHIEIGQDLVGDPVFRVKRTNLKYVTHLHTQATKKSCPLSQYLRMTVLIAPLRDVNSKLSITKVSTKTWPAGKCMYNLDPTNGTLRAIHAQATQYDFFVQ